MFLFPFLLQNIDSVPTIYVLSKHIKTVKNFLLKFLIFTTWEKLSILHGHVLCYFSVSMDTIITY